jgi:starch phosphorylase
VSVNGLHEEARALAGNLGSLWNGGRDILDRLVEAVGDRRLSPWGALERLGPQGIEDVFATNEDRDQLTRAFQSLTRYLTGETWFDRTVAADSPVRALEDHPVAYFCMEFGLASWLPIYSGGLGILAGDVLKEASDLGLPMVGIGLFYRQGFFYQQLDTSNYQGEIIPVLDPTELPLEAAVAADGSEMVISVPIEGREVYARVWKLQVGRVSLYLLDTDTPGNQQLEDRAITASLYGGTQDTRIQQEMVLGIGGLRVLDALGISPSVISMNEGHAAFLGLELLCHELRSVDLETALQRTRSRVVYTNHTIVPAGNDIFDRGLVRRYLGPYADATGIGIERVIDLATRGQDDGFSMAVLAFNISGKANGVSELHAQVVTREWLGYPVEAVTNGVHVPTWLGPHIRALLDEYVPDWQGDDPGWSAIHDIPDERLQEARSHQRRLLVDFANAAQSGVTLDPDALTIVWARRFAEYKRAWLIAADLGRLARILNQPGRPVQLIISGKSHPRDEGGKLMLQGLLNHLHEDSSVAARVAFIEDYDERVARHLAMGADLWLNTPRKPLEASGTSGMKSSDNGGLQLTVSDGWAAEVDWWGVGWGVAGTDDASDAAQVYDYLENSVIPLFFDRDDHGIAHQWAAMMKKTMVITLNRYSARRMMLEYVAKLYLPLIEREQASAAPIS